MRLLARLAMARGGHAVDEPLRWWDTLGEETVRFWQEFDADAGVDCTWERHATQMATLDAIYSAIVNQYANQPYKPRPASEFMPTALAPKRNPAADINQQCDQFVKATSAWRQRSAATA